MPFINTSREWENEQQPAHSSFELDSIHFICITHLINISCAFSAFAMRVLIIMHSADSTCFVCNIFMLMMKPQPFSEWANFKAKRILFPYAFDYLSSQREETYISMSNMAKKMCFKTFWSWLLTQKRWKSCWSWLHESIEKNIIFFIFSRKQNSDKYLVYTEGFSREILTFLQILCHMLCCKFCFFSSPCVLYCLKSKRYSLQYSACCKETATQYKYKNITGFYGRIWIEFVHKNCDNSLYIYLLTYRLHVSVSKLLHLFNIYQRATSHWEWVS